MDTAVKPSVIPYVAVPVLLGQVSGAVAFAVNPDTARDIGMSEVPLPPWVFVVVWVVIYAGMGLAAWQLRRDVTTGAEVPLAVLVAGYLQTKLFWLSDSLHSVAIADVTGLLLAVTTVWVFSRYSRAAARWLLPWLVWMPVTLVVKVIALGQASG